MGFDEKTVPSGKAGGTPSGGGVRGLTAPRGPERGRPGVWLAKMGQDGRRVLFFFLKKEDFLKEDFGFPAFAAPEGGSKARKGRNPLTPRPRQAPQGEALWKGALKRRSSFFEMANFAIS